MNKYQALSIAAIVLPCISSIFFLIFMILLEINFGSAFSLSHQPQALVTTAFVFVYLFKFFHNVPLQLGVENIGLGLWIVLSILATTTIPIATACLTSLAFYYIISPFYSPLLILFSFFWVNFGSSKRLILALRKDEKRNLILDQVHRTRNDTNNEVKNDAQFWQVVNPSNIVINDD